MLVSTFLNKPLQNTESRALAAVEEAITEVSGVGSEGLCPVQTPVGWGLTHLPSYSLLQGDGQGNLATCPSHPGFLGGQRGLSALLTDFHISPSLKEAAGASHTHFSAPSVCFCAGAAASQPCSGAARHMLICAGSQGGCER